MSLFSTTLAVSFLVVALPHVLPCPVPAQAYADGPNPIHDSSRPRRRKQKARVDDSKSTEREGFTLNGKGARRKAGEGDATYHVDSEASTGRDGGRERRKRECPVPKPGGLVGKVLGFDDSQREGSQHVQIVKVEKLPKALPKQ